MKGSLVVTAMRNEGPFILEWVAWQQMLGFEQILVLHNDCTDHSPQLLRQLQRHGVLTKHNHKPAQGRPPQVAALAAAREHRLVREATWMFICDVDEFLLIHKGDGTVAALLGEGKPGFAGMAIHWLIYGDAGLSDWQDGLVHRKFIQAAHEQTKQNNCFKSFVHRPLQYPKFGSHAPHGWQGDGAWNDGARHWILADGTQLDEYHPTKSHMNGTPTGQISHKVAQVNHYILQEREKFTLKQGRKSAATLTERYTDDFQRRFNHNKVKNLTALKYQDKFDAAYARLLEIPGIRRLHHLCCADFVAELCRDQGREPEADARYRVHRDLAEQLPKHWKKS